MFHRLREILCCHKRTREEDTPEEEHTYIELDPEIELENASMAVHTEERGTSIHLYNRLLTERAYDEIEGSPLGELFNCLTVNVNDYEDPLVERVNCTLVTYDAFSLVREFMDLWKLPCFVVCRLCDRSITGLELLAIGSPATVCWIQMMTANEQVMKKFYRYSGLMYVQTDCAITVPRSYPAVYAPPTTPVAKRTPKTQYHQAAPGSAPPRVQYLYEYYDSATASEDNDSDF